MNALERGLLPCCLRQKTTLLYLKQVDDTMAYPRRAIYKNAEALGEFVSLVTSLINHRDRLKGGTKDTG